MIFIVVLAVLRTRSTRSERERTEAFWNRENEANNTRRVDLDTLEYFTFDPETLPCPAEGDTALSDALSSIRAVCEKKMLNLNGRSNTDLKLQYGPQNLELLTEYGDNFSELEHALLSYGKLLKEQGYDAEAIRVLEKGIALPTDLMENYEALSSWYEEAGTPQKTDNLKLMAEKNLTGFTKTAVLQRLNKS